MRQYGVYAITNTVTGERYIGSSVNVENRLKEHRSLLRHGYHRSPVLQAAWDRHGEATFTFGLMECFTDERTMRLAEQDYIRRLKPAYNTVNYDEDTGRVYLASCRTAPREPGHLPTSGNVVTVRSETYLGTNEAAAYVGRTPDTLARWAKQYGLHTRTLPLRGKTLFYSKSEIDDLILGL